MPEPVFSSLREPVETWRSGAGVKENSYHGPLANLLNEAGKTLTPRVRCIINLAIRGAGLPDGGLFTPAGVARRLVFL